MAEAVTIFLDLSREEEVLEFELLRDGSETVSGEIEIESTIVREVGIGIGTSLSSCAVIFGIAEVLRTCPFAFVRSFVGPNNKASVTAVPTSPFTFSVPSRLSEPRGESWTTGICASSLERKKAGRFGLGEDPEFRMGFVGEIPLPSSDPPGDFTPCFTGDELLELIGETDGETTGAEIDNGC